MACAGAVWAGVAWACGAAPAAAEVVIGVAAPLTGSRAAEGRELQAAMAAAVDKLNANGGVAGEPARLVVVDDGCAATRAAAAAGELVASRAALVVGHPCAPAAIAAARVYARAPQTTFIAPGVRHPDLTDHRAGRNVYRLSGRDGRQGAPAARHIAAVRKDARVAVVHDRTLLARTLAADFIGALTAAGGASPPAYGIVAGEKDYGAVVAKLKAGGTDAIYFAGFPAEAVVLLRQLAAAGLKAPSMGPFMGPDTLATPEMAAAGAELLGAVVLTAPDGTADVGALAAAGVEAWALAAAAAAPKPGAPAVLTGPYQTSIGALAFDAKGDASLPSFRLVKWSGAAWAPLEDAR